MLNRDQSLTVALFYIGLLILSPLYRETDRPGLQQSDSNYTSNKCLLGLFILFIRAPC